MASFHKQSSPYRRTPVKDFYLDIWTPTKLVPQNDDIEAVISAEHHQRPDKLANQLYGTPGLFWVFWYRNKDIIIDPINDFTSGKKILIPSKRYIQNTVLAQ